MIEQQVIQDIRLIIPEMVLALTFCLGIIAGLIFRKNVRIVGSLVFIGVASALFFTLMQAGISGKIFNGMIVVDPFSVFFKSLIALSALIIIVFSFLSDEMKGATKRLAEYYSLLIAMTLGMFLMAGAANMLMMVIAMELTSLSAYILAGYIKEADRSSEASLKYVIYGAVSSGIMLYGISILFGLTGATDYYVINHVLAAGRISSTALLTATILILVGFGFKISAVPFHFWTPDVYEGSPITITSFLSVASKAAGFAMMMRFFRVVFVNSSVLDASAAIWVSVNGSEWNKIIAVISVLTMTLGNLAAVWQDNLKRLLAYSSIAHAGYMLMGIAIMSNKGFAAIMIYFVIYLFMNLGAFFVVLLIANRTKAEDIGAYRGLGQRAPLLSVAMALFLLSLAGLPPTAGFIGKLYLFTALLDAKWIWLAVVGAINSVVSLYYYARILRYMFLRQPGENDPCIKIHPREAMVLIAILIPTILLGLFFTPLADIANASMQMFGLK